MLLLDDETAARLRTKFNMALEMFKGSE